jgi:thioredoxin-related protein
MLKKFLAGCLLMLIISGITFSQSKENYKPVTEFDPDRDAAKDIQDAITQAQKTNKRIILDVGGDWCIWCHRIDNFIESHKEIKEYLHKNFILVKVNYSKENRNEEVLSKYPEIPGYPHFFILESDGKLLHSQNTGELEKDKDYSVEKMMAFLKKWSP